MIAAFMCAALFLFFFCIVGAARMGLQAGHRKWHGRRHVGKYIEGCDSCWKELSQDERNAVVRANLDRAEAKQREKERIRYARERAEFRAKYPTHSPH